VESESELLSEIELPYSLDQTPLSTSCHTFGCAERNSCHSRIVATTSDVLKEIVAALEY